VEEEIYGENGNGNGKGERKETRAEKMGERRLMICRGRPLCLPALGDAGVMCVRC